MADEKSIIIIDGKEYEDVKIGSDPELRFAGIKARPTIPYRGKFGTDGPNSQVGELRPDPFHCPISHVFEIERVLRDGYRRFPAIRGRAWLAGTMPEGQPTGGHIHIGSTYKENLELKLESLDKFLAPTVLLLEHQDSAIQRRQTQYGKLAFHDGKLNERTRGFKTEKHYVGSEHALSHPGYEYRPLASWLISRQIACGVLSLAKVIAFQTHNKTLNRFLGTQLKFIPMNRKFSDAYVMCDRKFFMPMIPTIHRIVSTFKLFPKYEKYINYLFQLIYQGRTWDENDDLKHRWNIIPTVKQTEKLTRKASKFSFEEIWTNPFVRLDDPNIADGAALFMGEEVEARI